MGLSFDEQMELQDQAASLFIKLESVSDFEEQLSLQDTIVAVVNKLLGTAVEIAKTLYERLLAGEFLNLPFSAFIEILTEVGKEVGDVEKLKQPALSYVTAHQAEIEKKANDAILESVGVRSGGCFGYTEREDRPRFGPVRIKDKGLEYGGARDIVIDIDTQFFAPDGFREIIRTIEDAREVDTIILKINSPGGDTDSAKAIYVALLETKAKTVARIITAYSAGSIVAMACDEIQTTPHCSMMMHNASTFGYGKISELQAQSSFYENLFKNWFNELYQGFLSEAEVVDMLKGKDIYLTESDIKQRLPGWKPIRERRKTEAQANNHIN